MSDRSSIVFPTYRQMMAGYEYLVGSISVTTDELAGARPGGTVVWDSAPDLAEALGTVEQNQLFVATIHDAVEGFGFVSAGGLGGVADVDINRALGRAGARFFQSDDDRAMSDRLLQVLTIREVRDHDADALRRGGGLTPAERVAFDEAIAQGASPHAAWLLATMDPDEIVEAVRLDTYEEAGIDGDAWNPELGLDDNIDIVDAVYEHYPVLYEADPSMYWVGIAAVAGPQFYAGFLDINHIRKEARNQVAESIYDLPGAIGYPPVAPIVVGRGLTAAETADAMWMMETTFLGMQRQIFDDMAVQHYAYQIGGMALIRAYADGDTTLPQPQQKAELLQAWEAFEEGDLERSTELLVDREQRDLIQGGYTDIWNHSNATRLFITGASWTGSVDPLGGESFRDHRITPDGGIVLPTIELGSVSRHSWLPAMRIGEAELDGLDPSANVANENDRLIWIQDEVNAGVFELAREDPDELLRIVRRPHQEEAERYRMVPGFLR